VDLRLLGPLEVRLGDRPIELGPRKQRAVLAMLALEAGRTVSADHLSQGLWGDEPPPSGGKMVQLYVSHLRRLLDGDGVRIVTRSRGYELQMDGGEVDAAHFERLLGEHRPREALALWHGEALADLADEPFAAAEIRRLDELRLRAAETAIDADLEAGRHADVIGELDRLVAEQPLREHLHVQHMLALYRSGRQSDALAAYRDARAELVEQIGVEPGAELRALHEQVLGQDAALDLPAAPEPAPVPEPRPPPVRRTHRLLFAAAAVLLAGITAFGVIRVLEPEGYAGIGEDAVGVIDPSGDRITARYSVGRTPDAVTSGGGSVWVANQLDGTVSRLRSPDDPVVTIPVGGQPDALAFGAGSLWVGDGDGRDVEQVDPGSNKVLQRIDAANAPRSLAVAAGALWVVSGADGSLRRIEIGRAHASREIHLGVKATAIAAGAGAVWVTSEEAGTVTRVDPRSGTGVATVNVGNGPTAVAAGAGAVWVVNAGDGTLSRVDPAKNEASGLVRVGSDPTAVATGAGAVWVAGGNDGTVARVDPRGPRLLGRLHTGSSPSALAVAAGSVWTAATVTEAAHRGGTLRVILPAVGPIPANWLNDDGYSYDTWMLTSLAYDGLVAYRRVGGVAGATLVGALATRPPPPSPDGRTYVFTLRKGLRYADGTPVRPEDFRASMERSLRANGDWFPPFYAGIVGVRRCLRRPVRCDLSRGIESEPSAGPITVHLTAPDAEFLQKLTLPFAFVVPSGTPATTSPNLAPPGTGPYRIAAWNARRGARLVRNPRFRGAGDRPAGFADRIEFTSSLLAKKENNVATVERGGADALFVASLIDPLLAHGRLKALVARAPGQVHSGPAPSTNWMFLNTRRPPFDSLRVRQAVNFATDRAALVEMGGGPEVATPTCQIVPHAFPGFEPYCPYSANPAPGRGWIAPDVERAHRLIAQSGRAGASVVIDVPRGQQNGGGTYFVSLLRRLGFRARLRLIPPEAYFDRINAPGSRDQMGFFGWSDDYLSASTFLETNFTCAAGDPPHLCDAGVTRARARARATTGPDAAAAWAAVDRRLVDLAPFVPTVNDRSTIFVSKRVGDVTFHPQWTALLDRMWVR
jgi:ABC-type transport system substrate-binding protein/DNA-binding SARP family transcriptional activator